MGLFDRVMGVFGGKAPEVPAGARPGRNEACWCGSGRKYKKCHLPEDEKKAVAKACALNCGPT
ncbi:MAG: SEC-C metal-binding domain-containing protein [Nitrospirota bacterium]